MKKPLIYLVLILDVILAPLTFISSIMMKFIRKYLVGFWSSNAPMTKSILNRVGVFPILKHYYEPYFYTRDSLKSSLRQERNLPGINFNLTEQLELLNKFNFNEEIIEISLLPPKKHNYSFDNGSFESGDSETLYNMIRYFKPKKIIEVGCGNSTLMIQHAIHRNLVDSRISCEHVCIEPYLFEHLAQLDVKFLKYKIEEVDKELFKTLGENDILFIDSSHMIRPQGDVLLEYLEILPILKPGVFVHIHDIFSPRDYLDEWIKDGIVFWNEQYLLEAFLTFNNKYKIICATNFLMHNNLEEFQKKCPMLKTGREPGSFWIQRTQE
jgi:hypothetical protein